MFFVSPCLVRATSQICGRGIAAPFVGERPLTIWRKAVSALAVDRPCMGGGVAPSEERGVATAVLVRRAIRSPSGVSRRAATVTDSSAERERRITNPEVARSNRARGTTRRRRSARSRDSVGVAALSGSAWRGPKARRHVRSSEEERDSPKVEVGGSSPPGRALDAGARACRKNFYRAAMLGDRRICC